MVSFPSGSSAAAGAVAGAIITRSLWEYDRGPLLI
jgi:hypothetical protein